MRINKFSIMSMEMIDFQNKDPVIDKLEKEFRDYKEEKINESSLGKNLSNILKDRLGFNITVTIEKNNQHNAYYEFNLLDNNHILVRKAYEDVADYFYDSITKEMTQDNVKKIIKGEYNSHGLIDYKRAKVSGIFSQLPVNIIFFTGLIKVEEPIESVATLMHEVGHAWTFFEYLGVTSSRNALIANSMREYLSCKSETERKKFIVDTNNIYGISIPKEVVKGDDNSTVVVLGAINKKIYNDVGQMMYDRTMVESVADQFATRFGLGYQNAKGLNKYQNTYWIQQSFGNNLLLVMLAVLTSQIAYLFTLATLSSLTIAAMVLYFGILSLENSAQAKIGQTTYDTPRQRINRIRNELIAQTKTVSDKSHLLELVKQIDDCVKLIEEAEEFNPFFLKIVRWFSNTYRKEEEKKIYQQITEDLINNELYVSALKLKHV